MISDKPAKTSSVHALHDSTRFMEKKPVTQNPPPTVPSNYKGEMEDLPRKMDDEAVFNSHAFHRLVTYEEKEHAIQVAIDAFDNQRNKYTRERNIVEDDIMLLIVNFLHHQEMYKLEKKKEFRRLETTGENYLKLGDPRYTEANKTTMFDTRSHALHDKKITNDIQKRLIESLALDSHSLEKKLSSLEGNKKYRVSDFKKDLVRLAMGSDVFDLTTGAARSVINAGVQGKKFSDITRNALSGAFKTAADTSECDDGQFVFVNGEKICIPFKVTFDRERFMSALEDLCLSFDKNSEREALDRYEYLLIPKTSDDVYDPNIRQLDAKYKNYLNSLYDSYLKYLKGYFSKFGSSCSDELALPKMNEIYLDFFGGFNETDVDDEFRQREHLEKTLYSSIDPKELKINEIITRYVRKQSRYRSDMSVGEYYQMYLEISKVLGITLDPATNKDETSRKTFCDKVKTGPFRDATGGSQDFTNYYERYNCFQTGMTELLQNIKVLKEKINQKYEDILSEYSTEKSKIIAEEPTIKGKKQMKENDSRFNEVMKLMGAEEPLRVLYYGFDSKLFPIKHNFTPKHTAMMLQSLKNPVDWDPFYDYHTFNESLYKDPRKIIHPDPFWENYIRIVLPFYRYYPKPRVLPGHPQYITGKDGSKKYILDYEDEIDVPDETSDTYWVKPTNIPNTLFEHIRLKSHLMKKVDIHAKLQKSLIRNFLSLLEMIKILDNERLRKPGFGTEKFPPMIQRLIPMSQVLQPLKTGLMDLIRRDEDIETPVLRCLQKVNMEKYLRPLRDANYSTVTSFASLTDDNLRNIVEQKLNLTQEQKINLKTAVDCLEKYNAEETARKEKRAEERQTEERQAEERQAEERLREETQDEERLREETPAEERAREETQDEERLRETDQKQTRELEREISEDKAIIERDETKIHDLEQAESISEIDIENLKKEISNLKQSENVLKLKNRDLARSVDKKNKGSVQNYDLFQERLLQEVSENKRELSRVIQKKENHERQLRLMEILMLEIQKKRELDRQNANHRLEKIKQKMQKIHEQMLDIRNKETEQKINSLERKNRQEISKYSKQLDALKAEHISLQHKIDYQDSQISQQQKDIQRLSETYPGSEIPLTMTLQSPRTKTPKHTRRTRKKLNRGKRHKIRSHQKKR